MKDYLQASGRVALCMAGLTCRDIAARAGLSVHTVRQVISNNLRTHRTRLRVESVLGGAVWTHGTELEALRLISCRFGLEPWAITRTALRGFAKELKVRGRAKFRRRGELLRAVAAALGIHENTADKKEQRKS